MAINALMQRWQTVPSFVVVPPATQSMTMGSLRP